MASWAEDEAGLRATSSNTGRAVCCQNNYYQYQCLYQLHVPVDQVWPSFTVRPRSQHWSGLLGEEPYEQVQFDPETLHWLAHCDSVRWLPVPHIMNVFGLDLDELACLYGLYTG